MLFTSFASVLLATVLPVASPLASASPHAPFKTIVTVISSPYCNALAEHFNAAFVPMVANDRVFERVSPQLDDMNDMFKYPDYANRFLDLRTKMIAESAVLVNSLKPMQRQIDALQRSASLSTDPAASRQMRDAASQLRQAYQHQFQLSTDLQGMARSMMDYDITRGDHPLGGWTPQEQSMPADAKNIKVYLHFDQQRSSIADAENKAVDIAYQIAQNRCSK